MPLPTSRLDWNSPESVDVLKGLLLKIPGVESVQITDLSDKFAFGLGCFENKGIDALAGVVGCANGRVFVRSMWDPKQSPSDEESSVFCVFHTAKNEGQSNTLVYTVGFYLAIWLYRARIVDDKQLDRLEAIWPVNFQMHRG